MSELETLRREEACLEKEIEHNKTLMRADLPCCDIAALAERLSDCKKTIGALTVGKMFTA